LRLLPPFRQFVGNGRATSEVHLVRRLTIKSAMRHLVVVFLNIKLDQLS